MSENDEPSCSELFGVPKKDECPHGFVSKIFCYDCMPEKEYEVPDGKAYRCKACQGAGFNLYTKRFQMQCQTCGEIISLKTYIDKDNISIIIKDKI